MPWMLRLNASTSFQKPAWIDSDAPEADGIIYRDASDERDGFPRGQQSLPFLIWKSTSRLHPKEGRFINTVHDRNNKMFESAEAPASDVPDWWTLPYEDSLTLMDLHLAFLPSFMVAAELLLKYATTNSLRKRVAVAGAQIRSLMDYHRLPRSLHVRLDFVPCARMLRAAPCRDCFGADIQDWLQGMDAPPVQLRMSHYKDMEQPGIASEHAEPA